MTFLQFPPIRYMALGMAVLFAACPLVAQSTHWNSPSALYVYDSVGKTIRPIVGVPGSSYLGSVLLDGVDWASFAFNHKSALVSRGGVVGWVPDLNVSNLSADFATYAVPAIPLPRQIMWAADSTRAVALATGSPRLLWLGQFGSTPQIEASRDLDASQDSWSILAADSSANQVLAVSQSGDTSQLWLISQTKAPVRIPGFTKPVAAVIASGNSSAFVVDSATHQITLLRGLAATPVASQFVSSDKYVADPVGLALSRDGTRLFVPDGSGKTIRVFQTSTGALGAELPLQSEPVSLTPLSTSSFLLGGRTQKEEPFLFLDTRADGKVSFVPAGR